jgi:phosphoadenosine phosphosulfate reductase
MDHLIDGEIKRFDQALKKYKEEDKKVFASSSFQTHSIPMLHIISRLDNSIPIYFLNTGFHFPETLAYRDQIGEEFNLQIMDLHSPITKLNQRDAGGALLFASDPDQCCFLNKTLPMEPILAANDVWISGVRRDQNANRSSFNYETKGAFNTQRLHPMLDWTKQMIWAYIREHDIPQHPLEQFGYESIGCEPCTRKMTLGDENERGGRWAGMKKTECGLHTDLIEK